METLKINDLKNLLEKRDPCSISIFIPTRKEWNNAEQNLIRFKNHIQQIEKELLTRNIKSKDAADLVKNAKDLMEEKNFWIHQSLGLAVFISPKEFLYYRLPFELKEAHYISNRFCIKPILPYFNVDGSFFILSLDLTESKLYRASHYMINNIPLPQRTPLGLPDELKWEEGGKSFQFNTGMSPAIKKQAGPRASVFHGHGQGGLDEKTRKEKILEFFRELNDGVIQKIGGENLPLILAGVEFLMPLYKEANSYPNLFNKCLDIKTESLNPDELKDKAWELIKPDFDKKRELAIAKYRQYSGNHLASSKVEDIVKAAYHKRVEALFINPGVNIWGKFSPDQDEVVIEDSPQKDNEELLEFIAYHTLLNKGFIYACGQDKMPCDKPLAAVFRY